MIGTRLRDRFVIEEALAAAPGRSRWRARDERGRAEVEVWMVPAVREPARWVAAMAKARAVPGLRRVVEHGSEGGVAWVAYAAARPGPQVDAARPIAIEHVIGWARAVAAALEGAQRAGWSHGALAVDDVVMVGADLRIGGVGVWRELDGAAIAAAWGDDAWQLAPEVRAGRAATAATDVWSMAFGAARLAFGEARDRAALIERARAGGGGALGELIEAALADDPARRPTAGGFVEVMVRIARMTEPATDTGSDTGTGTGTVTGTVTGSGTGTGTGTGTGSVTGTGTVTGSDSVSDPDSVTVIGPPPSSPSPSAPPQRMIAISHSAEMARPKLARAPAPIAVEPVRPRVQIRPISEALPTAFSTKQGALGYMAPPAVRRAPTVQRSQRPLVIIASATIVVLIAIALVIAFAR